MTREEADFIGAMNMCDEISNEAYRKIMCHCEEQEPTTKNDLGVDCVARQDVERFIEGFINEYTSNEELEFINLELDGLKHLPPVTPQEPRWIPVSERLPEDHKDVLVYLSSDRISICRYNSHKLPFCNNSIGWGYLHEIGFIDFEKEHVIAWMPLPKPYKPQESEE